MTAPLTVPSGASKDAASARKRRRRAPAGGAADDCFTCSKRNIKCDRRRPYCSQCLEVGNDCSGYKTQLTWGVGVASRGKLRGLSLPIAKAPPVTPVVKKSPTRSRAGSTATSVHWSEQEDRACREDPEQPADHVHHVPHTPFVPYDYPQISSPDHTSVVSHSAWDPIPFSSSLPAAGEDHHYQSRPVHVAPNAQSEVMPSSMDSISDVDYMSPLAHPFARDDMPFIHSPNLVYDGFHGRGSPIDHSPVANPIMIESQKTPTSCPGLVYAQSEPSSSLHSQMDSYESHLSHRLVHESDPPGKYSSTRIPSRRCEGRSVAGKLTMPGAPVPDSPDTDMYSTSAQSHAPFWAPPIAEDDSVMAHQSLPKQNPAPWSVAFRGQSLTISPDLISRMPFFMDYYKNTMCPSLVLIDGYTNPFRDHVFQLSASSRSLQHAICALAACNLRMKRRLSLGQPGRDMSDMRLDISDPMSNTQPTDQSLLEEYQHRNLAVQLLNEQLNDSEKSRHDSVLATILLLCHYRMAESGIAKFHTQFAGVKKILGLRRSSPFPPSRDSTWMEAIFTYLDAISATVNEREAQLTSPAHGAAEVQLLPPGAENLVGCDQELFKTISKLGRLNLLSQNRPVQNLANNTLFRGAAPGPQPQSPFTSPMSQTYNKPTHAQGTHMGADPHGFPAHNGGFGTTSFSATREEEEMFPGTSMQSPSAYEDRQSIFWREWKDARLALQNWHFDSQRVVAGLSPGTRASPTGISANVTGSAPMPAPRAPTASQVQNLGHLSEAFRYSALLYTERLASPNVPSTHSNFRNLVSQVVYYATSLESGSAAEKFLLWPLFVAGCECVNELQQQIVRSKCREIMARSGYMNNLAALKLLERVWSGDSRDEGPGSRLAGIMRYGPFNWTKYMDGPGVGVEWIMF